MIKRSKHENVFIFEESILSDETKSTMTKSEFCFWVGLVDACWWWAGVVDKNTSQIS